MLGFEPVSQENANLRKGMSSVYKINWKDNIEYIATDSSPWQLQDQLVRQMPKLKKKDEHKETGQNLACRTQKHFRQGAAKMSR